MSNIDPKYHDAIEWKARQRVEAELCRLVEEGCSPNTGRDEFHRMMNFERTQVIADAKGDFEPLLQEFTEYQQEMKRRRQEYKARQSQSGRGTTSF